MYYGIFPGVLGLALFLMRLMRQHNHNLDVQDATDQLAREIRERREEFVQRSLASLQRDKSDATAWAQLQFLCDVEWLRSRHEVGLSRQRILEDLHNDLSRVEAVVGERTMRSREIAVAYGRASVYSGHLNKAKEIAMTIRKQLERHLPPGVASRINFEAEQLLGLVAIRQERLSEAGEHLLASVSVLGSENLAKDGPSMRLADELLEARQSEVVIQFVRLVDRFWESGSAAKWLRSLEKGEDPRDERWLEQMAL